jgi:hypothetical protein
MQQEGNEKGASIHSSAWLRAPRARWNKHGKIEDTATARREISCPSQAKTCFSLVTN